MGILNRIFQFGQEKIDEIERRMEGRYSISPNLIIKIKIKDRINLKNSKIVNISRGGLKVSVVDTFGELKLGDNLHFDCELEDHAFGVSARIVYIDCKDQEINKTLYLGLLITQSQDGDLWPYYQVVYPIILGHSLMAIGKPKQCEEDKSLEKVVHQGEFNSCLMFWFHAGKRDDYEIIKFELSVDHLLIFGNSSNHYLEIAEINPLTRARKIQDEKLHKNDLKMAFKFFKWFLLHLNEQFPESTKNYLKSFALKPHLR